MRNPERIKPFLEKLEKIWTKYPDMRFGQLCESLRINSQTYIDIFYIEDELIEKEMDKFIKDNNL